MRDLDDITEAIIDAAIQLHRDVGPEVLESVYEALLAHALDKRGFHVRRQVVIRFESDGLVFDEGFRIDLLVEDQVVVELKSVERLAPVHGKKLLTYLRLTNQRLGVPAPPRESIGLSPVLRPIGSNQRERRSAPTEQHCT